MDTVGCGTIKGMTVDIFAQHVEIYFEKNLDCNTVVEEAVGRTKRSAMCEYPRSAR